MLLDEFENVRAVIEPMDLLPEELGEICDTLIYSFNGEIVERVSQFPNAYEAGYLKRRLAAGATVVDMEASAIMAWAAFRKAQVYQFFYTADYVDHLQNEWDKRHEERTADELTFFEVAMVIAHAL